VRCDEKQGAEPNQNSADDGECAGYVSGGRVCRIPTDQCCCQLCRYDAVSRPALDLADDKLLLFGRKVLRHGSFSEGAIRAPGVLSKRYARLPACRRSSQQLMDRWHGACSRLNLHPSLPSGKMEASILLSGCRLSCNQETPVRQKPNWGEPFGSFS